MTQYELGDSVPCGLTERDAAARLLEDGPNELPSAKPRHFLTIMLEIVREPMLLLLLACGSIYLVLGDTREAIMLLGFVFVIFGITFYQERKTERALDALRDLSSPRALVIRDGMERRIAGREVVRDDILVMAEGDRVPADARLLSASYMTTDESLLTGESVPVQKIPGETKDAQLFSGTLVVQGKGIAKVEAVGANTQLGKIGKALLTTEEERTQLSLETGRLVRTLALAGIGLCVLVVVLYVLTRGQVLDGVLAGITLAMAIMPEEFPVVLTIFLALGAWRIAQKQVLTRRAPAIETLGAATVLCVDKTGTLTLNRMTVQKLDACGALYDVDLVFKDPLPESVHELVEYSILASQIDPFDPMEKAFKALGDRYLKDTEHLHFNWSLQREYPLSRDLLAMSNVWKAPDSRDYVIAAKGAPEAIADLCHFDGTRLNALREAISRMAGEGLRVLGVARAAFRHEEAIPAEQHDFDFQFVGLLGLADPVRPSVPDAIKECTRAGIRVVMITGDYPETARHIARDIGLCLAENCITGPELDAMSDEALRQRIASVNIFARVVPEQKLRLVNVLKANGEIVAMTGDGVNDAPALKSAHIGVAMGERGTDVAREAAALVLLDDDFSSIVQAVKMGRRIFDNIKKAMAYILAVHVPIAGLSLFPILFHWPVVLMPVHVVFLELIIDPACSVIFEAEAEEQGVMDRPPRNPRERLFGTRMVVLSILQGFSVLLVTLLVFGISLHRGLSEIDARALTFVTLIVANLGLILTNRSWSRTILQMFRSPNQALWWVMGGATAFLGLVISLPFLRDLFHMGILHGNDAAIALTAGIVSVLWFDLLKVFGGRKNAG